MLSARLALVLALKWRQRVSACSRLNAGFGFKQMGDSCRTPPLGAVGADACQRCDGETWYSCPCLPNETFGRRIPGSGLAGRALLRERFLVGTRLGGDLKPLGRKFHVAVDPPSCMAKARAQMASSMLAFTLSKSRLLWIGTRPLRSSRSGAPSHINTTRVPWLPRMRSRPRQLLRPLLC